MSALCSMKHVNRTTMFFCFTCQTVTAPLDEYRFLTSGIANIPARSNKCRARSITRIYYRCFSTRRETCRSSILIHMWLTCRTRSRRDFYFSDPTRIQRDPLLRLAHRWNILRESRPAAKSHGVFLFLGRMYAGCICALLNEMSFEYLSNGISRLIINTKLFYYCNDNTTICFLIVRD